MNIEETDMPNNESKTEAPYIGQTMRDLEERLSPKIEEAKEQLAQVNTRLKGFIRENPGTTLLCAVGVGYVIGKLASRR